MATILTRYLGAIFMMQSTQKIISAASAADTSTCLLTTKNLVIPSLAYIPNNHFPYLPEKKTS